MDALKLSPTGPVPADEKERLLDLRSFGVLGTPREEPFDGIAEVACELFQTRYALISLMDSERQWFKSAVGLELCETPRNISFCQYAIMGSDTFVVEDAQMDPRFENSPLVVGPPHIRFYAGAPLVTDHRHAIGTLCILDSHPRRFEMRQRRLLERMAHQVVDALQSRRMINQLVQQYTDELRYAQERLERP